jgi:serine/threonine-protein kinase HipA
MTHRCLYCYEVLAGGNADFHEKCSRAFFGTAAPPVLEYDKDQMQDLAKQIVIKSIAVTGVQPKLSLEIEKIPKDPKTSRFAIVGLWGSYILKPPTDTFPHLPENEDLTMHLAALFGITTAAHSLIRLRSGELAYIIRRFDRVNKRKLAQEDMCQLTETLTEDKYRSSMEKVGKHIIRFSDRPGLDLLTFFELSLFCFLTGNADMHLKNFALLTQPDGEIVFSPAYDLLSTRLAMPKDLEEAALTINGKKNRLTRNDFDAMAATLKIPPKVVENVYAKFGNTIKQTTDWIDISFLSKDKKKKYKELINKNAARLAL